MKCGGILLTGRGFYFNPLKIATINALKEIRGITDDHFIDTDKMDLKKVCMTGIFNKRMIAHSDIIATPIEINVTTNKRYKKADIKPESLYTWAYTIIKKFGWAWITDALFYNEGEHYSEESNMIPVLNHNLVNCHFWAGGNIYKIPDAVTEMITNAHVVQSREGLYIIIHLNSGIRRCIKLQPDLTLEKDNSKQIYQSLFPGYFKKEYL
jgi:hypothetical protein